MPCKIEVRNVSRRFGALNVVSDLNFSIAEGEFVAIVGPSGCGKSTLMRMICGFTRPDEGVVLVDGIQQAGPTSKGILISQSGSVFPWLTVQQNLLFGLDRRGGFGQRCQFYVDLVGLNGFENSYPHELSGGMLKRAEIARALMVNPEILYMDEPFSALDALTSLRLRRELVRILAADRRTALLITHDVEEAIQMADRIMVLGPRPCTIKAAYDTPHRHLRGFSSPRSLELKEAILQDLGVKFELDATEIAALQATGVNVTAAAAS